MSKRRKAALAGLTTILVVAGLLLLPGAYWRVYGWLRGEMFYDGRPASYYAACHRRDLPSGRTGAGARVWAFVQQLSVDRFGLPGTPTMRADAVPVLTALLADADPGVRTFAAWELGSIGLPAAKPALPALRGLRDDPDASVAHAVAAALSAIDADAAGP
jgi:hypothetical protein